MSQRGFLCLLVTAAVLAWSVMMYGGFGGPIRWTAAGGTAIAGLLALLLLPGGTRTRPTMPWPLTAALALLFGFGAFMTLNAVAEHSMVLWEFTAVEGRILEAGPGSVSRATSLAAVLELLAVTIGVFGAVRAAESPAWMALVKLMVVIGTLAAIVGFAHKAAGMETVWGADHVPHRGLFAPFHYHATAGAFLNLCLPLALGLTFSFAGSREFRKSTALWGSMSLLLLVGVLVTASKGAIIVLIMLLPAMLIWNRKRLKVLFSPFLLERRRRLERILLVCTLSFTALLLLALGIGLTVSRFGEFLGRFTNPEQQTLDTRVGLARMMIRMAGPEEGSWHGFGPGTFPQIAPYFTKEEGEAIGAGRPLFGHSDPLQTLVEWGWVGAVGWFVIGAGAVVSALLVLRRKRLDFIEVPVVRGMVLALLGVGAHACIDYPLSIYSVHLVTMLLCGVCWGLYAERRREMRVRGDA